MRILKFNEAVNEGNIKLKSFYGEDIILSNVTDFTKEEIEIILEDFELISDINNMKLLSQNLEYEDSVFEDTVYNVSLEKGPRIPGVVISIFSNFDQFDDIKEDIEKSFSGKVESLGFNIKITISGLIKDEMGGYYAIEIFISKKQIRKFNEAIVDWETDNIKGFYQDVLDIISNERRVDFDKVKSIGDKYDVEIVDYDTFHSELPNDEMRKDAPPKGAIPVFGLVNPITHKARLVLQVPQLDRGLLRMAYHMLKHENIHVGQMKRKKDKSKGEFLGDIRDLKAYFSNKDEVMAFSQSVVDMIMDKNPKSLEEAKSELKSVKLWSDIKSHVDEKTKKRYIKYIYLYLEKEFEKLGIEDKRKPFKKEDDGCKYCGGKGYHKMSCPSTKMTINVNSDLKDNDISGKIDDLLKKAESGVLKYKEYNDLFDDIFDKIQSTEDESKKIHLATKLRKLDNIMKQELSKERSRR